jgi:hypothetical protein
MMSITIFKRITDVQATWKEHGWTPPSKNPATKAKWKFYRTLDTGESSESVPAVPRLEEQSKGDAEGYAFRVEVETSGL